MEPSIEIGVYGGYTDTRGDAAKNSLSLLKSLYSHWVRNKDYPGRRTQTVARGTVPSIEFIIIYFYYLVGYFDWYSNVSRLDRIGTYFKLVVSQRFEFFTWVNFRQKVNKQTH